MANKTTDYDHYVEGDGTSLDVLINPLGFDSFFDFVVETLYFCDYKNHDLHSPLATFDNLFRQSRLTKGQVDDLALEFSTGSWKIEDKSAHAKKLSLIKLALAKRAVEGGDSELAWEALSSASYYSGFYEAVWYKVTSPTAQRSAKGGSRKAEIKNEEAVLFRVSLKPSF